MTVKTRDEFEVIEHHLKNYVDYKIGIENLKQQMDHMFPQITASYDLAKEGSSGTFMFKSNTEDYAINRVEAAEHLEKEIEKYEVILRSVDRAVDDLDKREQKYVKLRYFEGLDNRSVCDKMQCSLKMMYKTRDSFKKKARIRLRNLLVMGM